jgi:hypothetical protein
LTGRTAHLILTVMKRSLAVLLVLACVSCGDGDDLASLSIQIHSPSGPGGSLRRFPPNTPLPKEIRVQIFRSFADDSDLLADKAVDIQEVWEDLPEDPTSGKKYLLITVPSNAEKDYTYVLHLASLVENVVEPEVLYVDECGVIGDIRAEKGDKVRLDIYTHLGDCSELFCSHDGHCIGSRYCLSFECKDGAACMVPDDCPEGAYCNEFGFCDSLCTTEESRCTGVYRCCGGICSVHCPD